MKVQWWAHLTPGLGSGPELLPVEPCRLHVLPTSLWLLASCSGLLPGSKVMPVCQPCDELASCPGSVLCPAQRQIIDTEQLLVPSHLWPLLLSTFWGRASPFVGCAKLNGSHLCSLLIAQATTVANPPGHLPCSSIHLQLSGGQTGVSQCQLPDMYR